MSRKQTPPTRGQLPRRRADHEPPPAAAHWGWRYHHTGIPTDIPRAGEQYLEQFKVYVAGFDTSPYGIEWMRFEPGSPVSELIRTVPHIAFQVDHLEEALEGKEIISDISSPSEGVCVAMILHNGAPIEVMEFRGSSSVRKRKSNSDSRPRVKTGNQKIGVKA
jgi:hypothetical protein